MQSSIVSHSKPGLMPFRGGCSTNIEGIHLNFLVALWQKQLDGNFPSHGTADSIAQKSCVLCSYTVK